MQENSVTGQRRKINMYIPRFLFNINNKKYRSRHIRYVFSTFPHTQNCIISTKYSELSVTPVIFISNSKKLRQTE